MYARFLVHYEGRIADASRLYPGVVEALDALEQSGGVFAVCTNKVERPAKLLLEKLGVADRFAFVCGQDTFGIAKPDPRPLLKTIEAAGGKVGRSIMVGDFTDRHRHRPRRRNSGDRGRFRLYRPPGERIWPGSGHFAFQRTGGGGGGVLLIGLPALRRMRARRRPSAAKRPSSPEASPNMAATSAVACALIAARRAFTAAL